MWNHLILNYGNKIQFQYSVYQFCNIFKNLSARINCQLWKIRSYKCFKPIFSGDGRTKNPPSNVIWARSSHFPHGLHNNECGQSDATIWNRCRFPRLLREKSDRQAVVWWRGAGGGGYDHNDHTPSTPTPSALRRPPEVGVGAGEKWWTR